MKIVTAEKLSQEELQKIVDEEKAYWAEKGKELGEVHIRRDKENGDLVVTSYPTSPITRIRRITGYLSNQNNFNAAKRAELADREKHEVSRNE